MPVGFFKIEAPATTSAAVPLLPHCGACGLYKRCATPKMPIRGKGRREILIVDGWPTGPDDGAGRLLTGDRGSLLASTLAENGVDLKNDCWRTSALICSPTDAHRMPREGTHVEIDHCRPNVVQAIKDLQPKTIILLGPAAVRSVIGWLWKQNVGDPSRWDGWKIPSQQINAWVCPTWDLDQLLADDYGSRKENEVRMLFFRRHIAAACEMTDRPWAQVPTWEKDVRVLLDDDRAEEWVDRFIQGDRAVAFDYECDRLKPEHPDARIISCSLSDGRRTIAFPWVGSWPAQVKRFLRSRVPKIASNLKFEERWTLAKLGVKVRNWQDDTMIAAHCLDNRRSITSIKFQAFVLLGQPVWNARIEPFLRPAKGNGNNARNRIHEVPLRELLVYNGMDSLLEHKAADVQRPMLDNPAVRPGYDLFIKGSIALAEAEHHGVKVDVDYLDRVIARMDRKIAKLQDDLEHDEVSVTWRKTFGAATNFGSNDQFRKIVYGVLKMPVKAITKTMEASTSKAALEGMDIPFLKKREKIETLKKARSTYLVGLKREIVNDRVHCNFSLAGGSKDEDKSGARSYRSACSDPNLQNQLRRMQDLARMLRDAFVADDGCRVFEIDFAAVEFRIAACFWKCPDMIAYASDPKKDAHRDLAADLFMCRQDMVSRKPMRDIAKNQGTFPILYGSYFKKIAPRVWKDLDTYDAKLVDGTSVKVWLAKQGITSLGACAQGEDPRPGTFEAHVKHCEKQFMARFPVFAAKRDRWYEDYRKRGGFPFMSGFWLNGLYSKNDTLNYPIQGPAFHILLWCMIEIMDRIRAEGMRTKVFAEIHDAILGIVPDEETNAVLDIADEVMTRAVRKHYDWIATPLEIEASVSPIGGSWAEKVEWVKTKAGVWTPKESKA